MRFFAAGGAGRPLSGFAAGGAGLPLLISVAGGAGLPLLDSVAGGAGLPLLVSVAGGAGLPLLVSVAGGAGLPPLLLQTLDLRHQKLDELRGCSVELRPDFTHIIVRALPVVEAALVLGTS